MTVASNLQSIISPAVEALGYELIGCELHTQPGGSLLRVYVDNPEGNGITLDDCAKISRQISALLDVQDPIRGRYVLEVSSPGMDRPLFTADHYKRFVGYRAKIRLRIPREEGRRNFSGVIKAVEGEKITFQPDEEAVLELNLNEIEKAKLVSDH